MDLVPINLHIKASKKASLGQWELDISLGEFAEISVTTVTLGLSESSGNFFIPSSKLDLVPINLHIKSSKKASLGQWELDISLGEFAEISVTTVT